MLRLFAFLLFFTTSLSAEVISLRGHLDKDLLDGVFERIEDRAVLEVDSSSGELGEVINFAKRLYGLKQQKQLAVTVYVHENAIGPAAIIPFLADELYVSLFASWGDIALGSEGTVPTNILRTLVENFVSEKRPNWALTKLLARAMADPDLELVDDGGWRLSRGEKDAQYPIVCAKDERLVISHNQMRQLALVEDVLARDAFFAKYQQVVELAEEELPSIIEELKKYIPFNPDGKNRIGHIAIDDQRQGITQSTWVYVRAALEYYKKKKPVCVILELNTPGGEVFSSQKISDMLKDLDRKYNIPVIAVIDNWAISAGAMLAYSCRFIVTVKDGSMGAAEPVFASGGEMQSAPEKVNSALRTDFANRAGFFDRDPAIAEAMVDKDMTVVRRHGKIVKLNSDDEIRKGGLAPDEVITKAGKLLTLNSEQMIRYGVADIVLDAAASSEITFEERSKGRWPAEKMDLFQHAYFEQIPDAFVDAYRMDWRQEFLALLLSPAVSSMLFLGMMLGFYMEMNTPGFGLPGSVALLCLFFIVLSGISAENLHLLELIFFLAGVVLIAVEAFVLPGFGVAGVAGIIFLLAGLFGMMLPGITNVTFEWDTQTFNAAGEVFINRLGWLAGTLVAGFVIMVLLSRYMVPSLPFLNRLVLTGEQDAEAGFTVAGEDPSGPNVGDEGLVEATLRPAGKAVIDGVFYDVTSEGEFIKKGEKVVVRRVEGNHIFVVRKG